MRRSFVSSQTQLYPGPWLLIPDIHLKIALFYDSEQSIKFYRYSFLVPRLFLFAFLFYRGPRYTQKRMKHSLARDTAVYASNGLSDFSRVSPRTRFMGILRLSVAVSRVRFKKRLWLLFLHRAPND